MRLIDADDFIKKFRYAKANTEEENIMCATVRRMVKEQPTAYDVEEVVKELKELKMRYYLTIANTGDADKDCAYLNTLYKSIFVVLGVKGDADKDCAYLNIANAIDKAIDIVKRGGRNEE